MLGSVYRALHDHGLTILFCAIVACTSHFMLVTQTEKLDCAIFII